MELKFHLSRIPSSTDLSEKFSRLGSEDRYIHRIMAIVRFVLPDGSESPPFDAIVDTGAVISLFHESWLPLLQIAHLEPHTLYGVVNLPECRIASQLGRVNITLEDDYGKRSSRFPITAAFCSIPNTPSLIGMKELLANYSYSFETETGTFKIEI